MKKRVVSLLLCLVMILSAFLTGCSKKTTFEHVDDEIKEVSKSNVTLSMWVVCEDPISLETQRQVSKKLSDITEEALKIRLAVTFYTKDEYEQKLSEAIASFDALNTQPSQNQPIGNEPVKEGELKLTFPALLENQVDILYIEGEEMYNNYVANGWLEPLGEYLNASMNKPLKEYLSSAIYKAAKFDGKLTYAIPNNNPIGQYKYMLLDKELYDAYYGNFVNGVIDGFYDEDLHVFLETVAQNRNDVTLIDGSYEECLSLLAHYWSFDSNSYRLLKDFALFGHAYKDADVLNRGSIELGYTNLFANKSFKENFLKLNKYVADGYFDTNAGQKAAVKFVDCSYTEIEEYKDDYYAVPVAAPTVTEKEVFDNGMFGVCSKSVNHARSMQVITYINTKADFRNILLYGIPDVHFGTETRTVNGVDYTVAVRYNKDYMMSLAKTGNVFLAYPTIDKDDPTKDMPADIWVTAKIQNYESVIDPTIGFSLTKRIKENGALVDQVNATLDVNLFNYMNNLNAELVALINATKTGNDWYGNLEALVNEIEELLNADSKKTVEDFTVLKAYLEATDNTVAGDLATLRANLKLATSADRNASTKLYSPYGVYKQWLTASGLTVKK